MKSIKSFSIVAFVLTVLLTGCTSVYGIPEVDAFTSEADGEIRIISIEYGVEEFDLTDGSLGAKWYLTTEKFPDKRFTVVELRLRNTEEDKVYDFSDVVLKNDELTVLPISVKYERTVFSSSNFSGSFRPREIKIPKSMFDYRLYLIYVNPIDTRYNLLDYRGKEIKIIKTIED